MLEKIKCRAYIPERRKNDRNILSHPVKFMKKLIGLWNMFDGMRTENMSELFILKRETSDVDYNKFRDFIMRNNVSIYTPSVDTATADIQIPDALLYYTSFQNGIAEVVEKPEDENDKANDEDNQDS